MDLDLVVRWGDMVEVEWVIIMFEFREIESLGFKGK